MSITITVENGSGVADANSYRTLDQLKAYYASHPYGAALLEKDDDELSAGLIQAARSLDASAIWRGQQVKWDQAMAWPRLGLWPTNPNAAQSPIPLENVTPLIVVPYDGGAYVPPDKVPPKIGDAQCELVRFVLASDRDVESDVVAVKREKLDVIEVEYQPGAKKALVPEIIQRLIAPYVKADADDGPIGGLPTSSSTLSIRA